MTKPTISSIVAIDKGRGLGKDGQLLFHIKEDMRRFKAQTTGQAVIMGRKTYESIGKALPNRTNIVVTRQSDFVAPGAIIAHSLKDAIDEASKVHDKIFIIGGGEIYKEAMPLIDKLMLTIVDTEREADTFFPDYSEFSKVIKKEEGADENFTYTFFELEKGD